MMMMMMVKIKIKKGTKKFDGDHHRLAAAVVAVLMDDQNIRRTRILYNKKLFLFVVHNKNVKKEIAFDPWSIFYLLIIISSKEKRKKEYHLWITFLPWNSHFFLFSLSDNVCLWMLVDMANWLFWYLFKFCLFDEFDLCMVNIGKQTNTSYGFEYFFSSLNKKIFSLFFIVTRKKRKRYFPQMLEYILVDIPKM